MLSVFVTQMAQGDANVANNTAYAERCYLVAARLHDHPGVVHGGALVTPSGAWSNVGYCRITLGDRLGSLGAFFKAAKKFPVPGTLKVVEAQCCSYVLTFVAIRVCSGVGRALLSRCGRSHQRNVPLLPKEL